MKTQRCRNDGRHNGSRQPPVSSVAVDELLQRSTAQHDFHPKSVHMYDAAVSGAEVLWRELAGFAVRVDSSHPDFGLHCLVADVSHSDGYTRRHHAVAGV